ncbi:MAG: hypothetical protein IPK68_23555 [Bdellovibrionales bacterium]|nr:hypothetical protein [Bdellovibrionales bacterium]
MIQRLASKPSVNLLCPRHLELAEPNLRSSGSSSVWCSAHNGSAAADACLKILKSRDLIQPGTLGV